MNDGITIEDMAASGGTILFAGTAVDVLVPATATRNAFSLLRVAKPPGCWTPVHLHRVEDETVYVLSGTIRALLPDGTRDLLPGQALLLPRGQPHRLGNIGPGEARFLVLCAPGGFDAFVRAAGRLAGPHDVPQITDVDVARLVEAAPRYGIELLAPEALEPTGASNAIISDPPLALGVPGLGIDVLAAPGCGADGLCLIRGSLPPGAELPWHGHADPEAIHVLASELQVASGQAAWMTFSAGETVLLPNGIPHALRNRGEQPATVLLVATQRRADLFREVGRWPGAFATAAARDFTLPEARR